MNELLNTYRAALRAMPLMRTAQPVNINDSGLERSTPTDVAHLLWMLDQIEAMVDRLEGAPMSISSGRALLKVHRWLGFVQGWMWHQHVFTIDEMREQIRKALQ